MRSERRSLDRLARVTRTLEREIRVRDHVIR